MESKRLKFLIILIFLMGILNITFLSAELGFNNPNLPKLERPEIVSVGDNITINQNITNINQTNITNINQFDQSLNTTDNVQFQNLTLSNKITFGFLEVIDNIVNGWIRITGGLNVTDNVIIDGGLNVSNNSFFENNITSNEFFLGDTVTPESHLNLVNKEYVDDAVSSTAFDFFFNNFSSDIANHFNMTESDLDLPESSLTTGSLTTGTVSIFNWTTLVGQPEFNELRKGVYDVHVHLLKSGTKSVTITPKLYNISADGSTRDLLIIFETSDALTTSEVEFDIHGVLGENIMLEDTARLNLELEANIGSSGSNPTVTVTMEGTTDSHMSIETSTNAFEKIYIRRDGTNELVGNWDQGSFNLTSVSSWFLGIVNWSSIINVQTQNSTSWNRSGTNVFLANSGDSVGIRTTTPQNTLNVIGDGNFTGDLVVGGNLTLNGFVDGNLTPSLNDTYSLGTSDLRWK
ncbi:hypothetical protein LCGC14_1780660, partial [marine sediment metagenome]